MNIESQEELSYCYGAVFGVVTGTGTLHEYREPAKLVSISCFSALTDQHYVFF